MDVTAKTKKLQSSIDDEDTRRKLYGDAMSKKIVLRVNALKAARSLGDFWPPFSGPERCHELKGDRAGDFSMDVKQPYRLLFVPSEEVGTNFSDERERWEAIKAIELVGIEDTHG